MADLNHSESLSVGKISKWVESRIAFVDFLNMFEPKCEVLQQPWIFMNFPEINIESMTDKPLDTMGTLDSIARSTHSIT